MKLLLLYLLLSFQFIVAQDQTRIDTTRITPFVLSGYEILDFKSGDLNKDEFPDIILILKPAGEDTSFEEMSRPLLLLTGQSDSSYKFAARNDKAVLCRACGGVFGDPYAGITIKNGYFSLEFYGGSNWRWTRIITFKYSDKDKTWLLHRDGGDSFHTSDPDKVETKVKTVKDFGRMPFEEFDYDAGD